MLQDTSASTDKPVLVIGAASLDMVGRPKGEMQTGSSVPAQIRISAGGVARNVAENLARLGQPVVLLSVVGSDPIGEMVLKHTAEAGVNVDAVLRTSLQPTGAYLGVVNASGELQFGVDDMRALALISPEYIRQNAHLFQEAAMLFIDTNLPKETMRTVMSLARKSHLPVCADPTSTTLAEKLCPYLKQFRLITPNSAEAAILVKEDFSISNRREAMHAAKALVAQGVEMVVIALAKFGVAYATSETSGHIPAIRTEIIDPTGAGDALTATVLFGLLNDMSIDDAVRLGVSAASLTLRHRGSVAPDLSLEKLYDQLVI